MSVCVGGFNTQFEGMGEWGVGRALTHSLRVWVCGWVVVRGGYSSGGTRTCLLGWGLQHTV